MKFVRLGRHMVKEPNKRRKTVVGKPKTTEKKKKKKKKKKNDGRPQYFRAFERRYTRCSQNLTIIKYLSSMYRILLLR